jgi:hypothetical protein
MSAGNPIPVRLGVVDPDGVAVLLYAVVARGVERRPSLARAIAGEVEVRLDETAVPVRIAFVDGEVLVEDGASDDADVVVRGRLPDLAQLLVAPAAGEAPLADAPGRMALARIATQQVRVDGQRMLARKMLALLAEATS